MKFFLIIFKMVVRNMFLYFIVILKDFIFNSIYIEKICGLYSLKNIKGVN